MYPVPTILRSYLDVLLSANVWTQKELLRTFKYVNEKQMIQLMLKIFSSCKFEVLTHGNMTKKESIALSQRAYAIITGDRLPMDMNQYLMLNQYRDVQLINGTTEYSLIHDQHENHGFLLYHQVGLVDLTLEAQLELFHQIISEPYFNQIRMAEQLAYVTFVKVKFTSCGSLGLLILIQSAYSLQYIESRVDAFLESLEVSLFDLYYICIDWSFSLTCVLYYIFYKLFSTHTYKQEILQTLKQEEFIKEKNALITKLSEEPKSLFAMSTKLWWEIISSQYIFDRDKRLISILKKIELNDIIHLYQVRERKRRKKEKDNS